MSVLSSSAINKFKLLPTPFYYYDLELLRKTLISLTQASRPRNFHVHYALKANTHERILSVIREYKLGADCVSGNEVSHALKCGFEPADVVFAGVGKSDEEIKTALQAGIFCFNVESIQEVEVINQMAGNYGTTASIALRVNPNVNPNTHHYITTGLSENKFGINPWEFDQVLELLKQTDHIKLTGLHFHIGSQISDMEVFKNLCTRVNEIQHWFSEKHIQLNHINAGGGLGIDYSDPDSFPMPNFEKYFSLFKSFMEMRPGQELHFELGRAITGQCGNLISKVLYIKNGINTNFAILDAGMTELIRPALYQAAHKVNNLSNPHATLTRYDVVGPICESSDVFGKAMMLPLLTRGDLVAIRSAGAYGEVMASQYNLRRQVESYCSDDF